jgi:hypothetical protein
LFWKLTLSRCILATQQQQQQQQIIPVQTNQMLEV